MADRRFTLLDIYDLREVDFFSGKKIPLTVGEGNECMRCGRLHAVVWVVRDNETGQVWKDGSGCGPRALGGWTPDKDEIRAAKKAMRERAEAKREAKLEAAAEIIATEVAALPEPEITSRPSPMKDDPNAIRLDMGDAHVMVTDWAKDPAERRVALRDSWLRSRVAERAGKNYELARWAMTRVVRKKGPASLGYRPAAVGMAGKRRHAPSPSGASRLGALATDLNRLVRR